MTRPLLAALPDRESLCCRACSRTRRSARVRSHLRAESASVLDAAAGMVAAADKVGAVIITQGCGDDFSGARGAVRDQDFDWALPHGFVGSGIKLLLGNRLAAQGGYVPGRQKQLGCAYAFGNRAGGAVAQV